MTDKEKIIDLLQQPLYKKVQVSLDFFNHPMKLEGFSFPFFCPNDNSTQTFKLRAEPASYIEKTGGQMPRGNFMESFDYFDFNVNRVKFTQHYSATCQLCEKFKAQFILQVESSNTVPLSNAKPEEKLPDQIVKKIGQSPPYEIQPDALLLKFLNEEDKDNYKKALICLSQNYSIGAYAYLRRIVENEIVRIIEDLSKYDSSDASNIEALLSQFRKDHVMSKLVEGIFPFLPASLKSLGNPVKLLYEQLSGGIHEFSESECAEKAASINTLLVFVIKKIQEENSDVKTARESIMKLSQSKS